ncbi:hypothetical protein [Paenibacillus polymyxa]|uniref:hypothetical protein n=1 Tax=Paenibacillus polymyxa TaxID=1406 RepID=UPI0025B64C03|nr:hypothetical protein [Paenibacillus polymyxa]MDN4106082.1 hypothetical protein [Paenibacillus polymyxa]
MTASLNNLDQEKRSGELLELAYIKIKEMIADNFDIVYPRPSKYSHSGVLSKYPISADEAIGYGNQSVWIYLMRYLNTKPNSDKHLVLPSITLIFKGGFSRAERDDLPIKFRDSKHLFYNDITLNYRVNGIQDDSPLTRPNQLRFLSNAGMESILSGEREKDVMYTLRKAYDRYLSQIENGIQF